MDYSYFSSKEYNLSSSLVIGKYKSELCKDVLLHIVGLTKQHTINSTYKDKENKQYQVNKNQYQLWPTLHSARDVDIKCLRRLHSQVTKCPLSSTPALFPGFSFLGGKGEEMKKRRERVLWALLPPRYLATSEDEPQHKASEHSSWGWGSRGRLGDFIPQMAPKTQPESSS